MPVRIATYDGSVCEPGVALVTAFSLGNPGVHTEIWFDNCRVSTFRLHDCVECKRLSDTMDASEWHVVEIPIKGAGHAQAEGFIRDALNSHAVYSISIPELAMPKCILDSIDQDLDCCHPEKWDRLFCSQFALLFLRRCAVAGILDVPHDRQRLLWSVNSKGCLPSRLQIITDSVFGR
jgi:hypothetical protein